MKQSINNSAAREMKQSVNNSAAREMNQSISNSAVRDHLLQCNYLCSFDFNILARETKKFVLEIKENLIMRDKPSLNRNISSVPLYLFDRVS